MHDPTTTLNREAPLGPRSSLNSVEACGVISNEHDARKLAPVGTDDIHCDLRRTLLRETENPCGDAWKRDGFTTERFSKIK